MCKNGGTCRQMGPAAVSCICAPGYTGDLCEAQIAQPECGIEECAENCKDGLFCDCNPKDTDFTTARFDTRLQVVDQKNVNISQEVITQLTSYLLALNITLEDKIELLNISSVRDGGVRTVHVRIWATRRAAGALRAAMARLVAARARTNTLRMLPDTLYFEMQPALSLHSLAINQRPEVWEGLEFILTCMAYGSPNIIFTWYKDGIKINFNGTTRDIWTRTVSEDALGRRMSVLGVTSARQVDGGAWSCAADDAGRRRCRALTLTVITPPTIRLVPSTLTVYKGENVSMTCLAGAGRAHGVLGFSWSREKSLLPMQPDKHVWEDLYPAGSVLKLYNIQKSSEYRCQVSSAAGTNSAGVWVWALDSQACQCDTAAGVRWSRTAPGAYASSSCPPGYSGEITRYCEPKTGQHGVKWMLPNFSGCISDSLKDIYEQFMLISYGYSWRNVSEVSRQYFSVLRGLPTSGGSGVTPLLHAKNMLEYLKSGAAQRADRHQSAAQLLNIFDHLLTQPDAFLDEQKINEVQTAIVTTASMKNKVDARLHSFNVKSESGVHLEMRRIPIAQSNTEWHVTSAHVELAPAAENFTMVIVQYYNLEARLPSLRTFTDYNSGVEVHYAVCSQQVQIYISGVMPDGTLQHTTTLVFEHSKNYSTDASKLVCGLRSGESSTAWSVSECDVRVSGVSRATCRCRTPGTIALFTRTSHTHTDSEEELRGIVVICLSVSGAMCVCACALQLLSFAPSAARRRDITHSLLTACTAAGHAAAMFALSHCHASQGPSPGALEWVVATCWCAASAALCAQPLLLHAELAGTTQRRHSVGLLAGVCVLCCLSARLWGGSPLQVGSAASSIFAGGILLLITLTLALALCARRTLCHVTHKIPPDRRIHIKKRSRVVHHTLAVLLTSTAVQMAGVAYAQPGDKQVAYVLALSVSALANGVAVLICYVIHDEQCLRAMRSVVTLHDNTEWHDSPAGDTSISLYIKQSGEVESRGGIVILESGSSPVSSSARYWRPMPIERRQSNPDSRADIVRCVEYKPSVYGMPRHNTNTHAVCDLIPTNVGNAGCSGNGYMATVCLEPNKRRKPVPSVPCLETYSVKRFDTPKETCSICVQSNPDVSKITSPPIKSCLKKNSRGFTSSTSLPSMDTIGDDVDKPHIEHINREWNKAYDNQQADKMLNKISNDLDFLLNRTQSNQKPNHIEEAPT
ncbi:unnamed protein product [Arctia plantaginis]|uniref:Uncharacterized protein n=1 Tax=Arctia plantaginis TaxID=874455 RepID=A0A8S1BML5_ARCPL|nr:unnamed protein product [Arctia plantaginis]